MPQANNERNTCDICNSRRRCDVKHVVCRAMRGSDSGSGTVAGVMLIAMTAILIITVATAGGLLIRYRAVSSMADLAAMSAATALMDGSGADESCNVARRSVQSGGISGISLESCTVDGEDVQVAVTAETGIRLAPNIRRSSRAGPVPCELVDNHR